MSHPHQGNPCHMIGCSRQGGPWDWICRQHWEGLPDWVRWLLRELVGDVRGYHEHAEMARTIAVSVEGLSAGSLTENEAADYLREAAERAGPQVARAVLARAQELKEEDNNEA